MVCVEPDTLCFYEFVCLRRRELVDGGGVRAHRAARAGPADRNRGGDRLRKRLDYTWSAHGVRGALRQEPLRAAPQGRRRR